MGRTGLITAVVVAATLVVAASSDAATRGLQYVGTSRLSPRLQEITFRTPALTGDTGVRVLLPAGYDGSGKRRYPVLYLLNGAGDDQRAWTEKGDAERITAGYPVIVVMPSGGAYGNYVDWYNRGAGGPPMWETYHIRQLLPWIDSHFRTRRGRAFRAIAGLSMGGGGTMHYAARHPDRFATAASFSGAVDTNNIFVQPLTETSGAGDLVPPGSVYGSRSTDEIRWRGHNGWDLAENLKGLHLEVITGNGNGGGPGGDSGDPVESGVHMQSVSFHEKLLALSLPHLWDDYGAGGHTWFYWQRDLTQFLPRLMKVYAKPRRAPVPFDYRSIDTSYGVYGWNVTVARTALEFSRLGAASRRGFQLSGSGRGTVRTARLYRPRQRLAVVRRSGSGTTKSVLRADASGRLLVPVALGPANPYQEYSPAAKSWVAQNNPGASGGGLADEQEGWPVYTTTVAIRPLGRRHG
jgi:S-formylglutathione hydrolase FrmB